MLYGVSPDSVVEAPRAAEVKALLRRRPDVALATSERRMDVVSRLRTGWWPSVRCARLPLMTTPRPDRAPAASKGSTAPGGLLGLGLDGEDGHRRVTRGKEFLLVGGSEETHERMQDLVMRMNEKLKRRGKSFGELSAREFEDLADETVS